MKNAQKLNCTKKMKMTQIWKTYKNYYENTEKTLAYK